MTTIGNENKILMLPGASWMGDGLFKGTFYKTSDHQLGAAAPLKWQADSQAVYWGDWRGRLDGLSPYQEYQSGGGLCEMGDDLA